MKPCKLTKLVSLHQNLRSDEIVGGCLEVPRKGKMFTLFAKPLVRQADLRVITTTEVTKIARKGKVYEFQTVNSIYKLELL